MTSPSASKPLPPDDKPGVGELELPGPGTVIGGKYEIVRVIGKGGMGVVYEAKHLRLNQRVAVKMLKPAALNVSEFKPRFEREARTAALLRGRHVARIFDVDSTDEGLPFMVMEYLIGRDLDAELRDRGTLSVQEATGYVLQACIAMQEAHAAGIIHRDLKPANLFLTDESGDRMVKVLDFGISKLTHEVDTHLTGTFATVGTPLYMSPEQVRSSRTVDARSDIWSLAVILFEALAGQPPFHGSMTATAAAIVADKTPSLCALRPDVPPEFEQALGKALEKHPNRRYQDVQELAAALAPFGPARLPFGDSNPSLPTAPSSNPALVSRIVPPGSTDREWGSAAETMLIPAEERRSSRPVKKSPVRARLALGLALGAAILGVLLAAGAGAVLYHPTASPAPTQATATPTPTATLTPTPTPTPTLTPTATPTATPTPTLTPTPTPTANPTATTATADPTPTADPSASPTPEPSQVPHTATLSPVRTSPAPSYAPPSHSAASHPAPPQTARPPPPPVNPIFLQ